MIWIQTVQLSVTGFLEDDFGRDYFEFGPVVQEMPLKGISYLRAPDKLWVNWVFTQPGYPQLSSCKNNCIPVKTIAYFLPHGFWCGYTCFLIE